MIAEDDHPWFGIPFPGTYVTDGAGVIIHKFFENNLALRVGPEQMLRAVGGQALTDNAVLDAPAQQTVTRVRLDGNKLAMGVMRDLVARFELPQGRHLYARPAPAGMVAVDLVLDDHPNVVTRSLLRGPGEQHILAGTGESFLVHNGVVELRLPITLSGALTKLDDGHAEITLSGSVHWQTCDDHMCDVPQTERFELDVPIVGSLISEIGGSTDDDRIRPMHGVAHFQKMRTRHQDA